MNDCKFDLLDKIKHELTIEDALKLYEQGVCTICEDGAASAFELENYALRRVSLYEKSELPTTRIVS